MFINAWNTHTHTHTWKTKITQFRNVFCANVSKQLTHSTNKKKNTGHNNDMTPYQIIACTAQYGLNPWDMTYFKITFCKYTLLMSFNFIFVCLCLCLSFVHILTFCVSIFFFFWCVVFASTFSKFNCAIFLFFCFLFSILFNKKQKHTNHLFRQPRFLQLTLHFSSKV